MINKPKKYCNSILDAIGNTPMVKLNYFSKENGANIYDKPKTAPTILIPIP